MQNEPNLDQGGSGPGTVFRPNQQSPELPSVTPVTQPSPVMQSIPQPASQSTESIISQVAPPPAVGSVPQVSPSFAPEPAYQQQMDNDSVTSVANELQGTALMDATAPHVEWSASEYLANPKSGGWFVLLGLGLLLTAAAVYFVTGGDIVSTAVIVIIGILFGIFSGRQPQVLNYAIDNAGFHIGQKFYPYGSFKSFSVVHDGSAMGYISLMPLRRFMPPLIIHYDPNDEARIADTLSEYLPYEEHKVDIVDSITKRIRF